MWQGLPLMTEAGDRCGFVGDVRFASADGAVKVVSVDRGKTADILLGYTDIPASLVKGFKLGVGDRLNNEDGEDRGAIIVSPEVLAMAPEGGLAEKAGSASAVVNDKASRAAANVSAKVKPAAAEAAHKAGEAMNDGAYKLGVQLSKTKGMFSNFKEEYRRARNGEDSEDTKLRRAICSSLLAWCALSLWCLASWRRCGQAFLLFSSLTASIR